MVTSKDVAKLAGVSHTTVSRAFRGDSLIKENTYNKIMQAAKELHYTPNSIAANLRQQKSKTVGIIISQIFIPLFLDITRLLEMELQKHGYRLLVSFDDGDLTRQHNAIRTMASAQVESIIFIPSSYSDSEKSTTIAWMKALNIHFVQLVFSPFKELSSFSFDDIYGTYIGTKYLLEHGHRQILMVGSYGREEGYYQAYRELGIESPFPVLNLDDKASADNFKIIKEAILKYRPTAVFSICDHLNITAYGVLNELNLRITNDLSFLAYDDAYWLQVLNISAIGHPVLAVAKAITQQILEGAENNESKQIPITTIFKPFLIERSSVTDIECK